MIEELEIIRDVLRIEQLWCVEQEIAVSRILVILKHLGEFFGLLLLVVLVEADGVHPHVLDALTAHQLFELFLLVAVNGHRPVHAIDVTFARGDLVAPGIGDDVVVVGVPPRFEDKVLAFLPVVLVAEKISWSKRHGCVQTMKLLIESQTTRVRDRGEDASIVLSSCCKEESERGGLASGYYSTYPVPLPFFGVSIYS